jgi:hypothetical protein
MMLGFSGAVVVIVGILLLISALSFILRQNAGGAVSTGITGIAALIGGGYMRYLSQQSVRSQS